MTQQKKIFPTSVQRHCKQVNDRAEFLIEDAKSKAENSRPDTRVMDPPCPSLPSLGLGLVWGEPVRIQDLEDPEMAQPVEDFSDVPESFLHCHICDKRGYPSFDRYAAHFRGTMHQNSYEYHKVKLEAALEVLRANAVKAETRLATGLLKLGTDPEPFMKSACEVCACKVLDLELHMRLPQHKLVENFVFPTCCGKQFNNRLDFEEHRCSIGHLKVLYTARLHILSNLEEHKVLRDDPFNTLPEYLRLLKSNVLPFGSESIVDLKPYDPDRPNGE